MYCMLYVIDPTHPSLIVITTILHPHTNFHRSLPFPKEFWYHFLLSMSTARFFSKPTIPNSDFTELGYLNP